MQVILLVGVIIFFLFVLVKSAEMVEESFVFLAKKIKISTFFIGFVVLGIVTSLPEISISILSSQTIPELSVGNLIGATIVLFTLIIGLSAVRYGKLEFKGQFAEKEVLMGVVLMFLMIFVLLDQYISMFEGALLLGSYLGYVTYLSLKFNSLHLEKLKNINLKKTYPLFIKAVVGVGLLLISSSMIVQNAVELANLLSISPLLIGVLLLAVGTNIPEITILFISKRTLSSEKLALGNFFGSACVNPGILGLLVILSGGVRINNFLALVPALTILTLVIVFFIISSWTGKKVSRLEGIMLISFYIAFLITEILIAIN